MGEFDVAGELEFEPETFAGAEEAAEPQGSLGGDGMAAAYGLAWISQKLTG